MFVFRGNFEPWNFLSQTSLSHLAGMLLGLQQVEPRQEMVLTQIPSPKGIAPEAIALSVEINHAVSAGPRSQPPGLLSRPSAT